MTTTHVPPTDVAVAYDRVLVPVDFSALSWRVLPLARRLAHRFDAPLTVLHVDTEAPWADEDEQEVTMRLIESPYGHEALVRVVADPNAADGILHLAKQSRHTLIAMSTHGYTGLAEMVTGSTCERVLRESVDAVLTVGPQFAATRHGVVNRVVACLDMSDEAPDRVLGEAQAWAANLDVPLDLVTVLARPVTSDRPEQKLAARFERVVEELTGRGVQATSRMLQGPNPAREIVGYADSTAGTLLILSTHARHAFARTLAGSTATSVIRHSPTGVLLCRRPH